MLEKLFVGLNDLDDLMPVWDKLGIATYTVEDRKVLTFLFADDMVPCLKPGKL